MAAEWYYDEGGGWRLSWCGQKWWCYSGCGNGGGGGCHRGGSGGSGGVHRWVEGGLVVGVETWRLGWFRHGGKWPEFLAGISPEIMAAPEVVGEERGSGDVVSKPANGSINETNNFGTSDLFIESQMRVLYSNCGLVSDSRLSRLIHISLRIKKGNIIKPVGRGALAEAALAETQNIFLNESLLAAVVRGGDEDVMVVMAVVICEGDGDGVDSRDDGVEMGKGGEVAVVERAAVVRW
ncbi:hypothetical protein Tco_0809342 [Tanacetum coccineum]